MSDLQAKIGALPEWPTLRTHLLSDGSYDLAERAAALARLALAREWIASQPHGSSLATGADCLKFHDHARACTCGRDALLKALELPR